MNVQFRPDAQKSSEKVVKQAIADCDIHPQRKDPKGLYPYLEQQWRDHLDAYGALVYQGMVVGPLYPKGQPNASRRDAVPPEGGVQGSSLKFMQQQHLDPNNVTLGILCPLSLQGFRNLDLAAALARATNDWQVAEWSGQDKRLRASVVVANEDGEGSAKEIRKRAGDKNFAQVLLDEPQHRAARSAPLLADLSGRGRGRAPDRHPCLRQQRPSDHAGRLAELLHRGDGRPLAVPAVGAGEHGAGGRVRALPEAEGDLDRGRLRLGAVARLAARQAFRPAAQRAAVPEEEAVGIPARACVVVDAADGRAGLRRSTCST